LEYNLGGEEVMEWGKNVISSVSMKNNRRNYTTEESTYRGFIEEADISVHRIELHRMYREVKV